ncbi:MAG: hypothetical protein IJ099_05580 [Alphaproteobacteria bacterium]|nr:hypothetical protein [Alphaproteobacteria bacterium]
MKKLFLILGLFLSICTNAWAQDDAEYYQHIKESVKKFQDLIKTNNPQLIAQNVVYPYSLGWGVPSIHNEQEFVEKYDIILPEHLREYLINSPMDDWGSGENLSGICLNDCPDAHLTDDGEMLSVKSSEELKQYREEYIAKEKQIIHPSLKEYNYNLYTMETKDWLIRIDDMEGLYEAYSEYEKQQHYRLVLWKKGKTISDEPDIVIEHGTKNDPFRWEGYEYTFASSEYYCTFTDEAKTPKPIDAQDYYLHLYKSVIHEEPKVK